MIFELKTKELRAKVTYRGGGNHCGSNAYHCDCLAWLMTTMRLNTGDKMGFWVMVASISMGSVYIYGIHILCANQTPHFEKTTSK